ncbi:hypothetical protein CDD83_10754 [Cordyceps sp. RAO-2017]|nr:hypothetical protein CDD83_10754 [Cordyceps sp. RAO-2017]
MYRRLEHSHLLASAVPWEQALPPLQLPGRPYRAPLFGQLQSRRARRRRPAGGRLLLCPALPCRRRGESIRLSNLSSIGRGPGTRITQGGGRTSGTLALSVCAGIYDDAPSWDETRRAETNARAAAAGACLHSMYSQPHLPMQPEARWKREPPATAPWPAATSSSIHPSIQGHPARPTNSSSLP